MECKLIHVANGADVAKHLPELHKHFQAIGSPIMIGKNITTVSECGGTCVDMESCTHVDYHTCHVLL